MPDQNPATTLPSGAQARGAHARLYPDDGNVRQCDADELLEQLRLLRDSPLSGASRAQLLDLLYNHLSRLIAAELPMLEGIALPVPGTLRQRTTTLQALLALLAEMYFAGITPQTPPSENLVPLQRCVRCYGWHIGISQLVAAPTRPGIWRDLHTAYRRARQLGLAHTAIGHGEPTIEANYIRILMAGIAQPASFSAGELALVSAYIDNCLRLPEVSDIPPGDRGGVFWIDLDSDLPAHAMSRRTPTSDVPALFFACDVSARVLRDHLAQLRKTGNAGSLGLPPQAGSAAGLGALGRLAGIWGNPAKRRFPRRRQSYRVVLCAAFDPLWQALRNPDGPVRTSEWMVTNESPDGYLLMHVAGPTDNLRVGDVIAVQPRGETSGGKPAWHVGIVRWAMSENPEHVEIGMQQVATRAQAATIVRPSSPEDGTPAMILPEMPPIRSTPALLVETGTISSRPGDRFLLIDHSSGSVSDVRVVGITEETAQIEILNVVPDETM
ncbi:MAG: hypothetical protein FIB06_07435 [Betaproteobacteria bacterium]|nr:hypothetical protein [Betaproteobacteria bacterium]